jgi:hypothetical protein
MRYHVFVAAFAINVMPDTVVAVPGGRGLEFD